MVIDAWEHAFYLQYVNEKAKFFDAIWNLWNWSDIGMRLQVARQMEINLGAGRESKSTHHSARERPQTTRLS